MNGIVCSAMNALRELRHTANLGQREFAALLSVPLETLRTWDSGRRSIPVPVLQRAAVAVAQHPRQNELLPLNRLARELHVHVRTLQAAARTGRLDARFSCGRSLDVPSASRRARPANGSSRPTTGASAASKHARFPCPPCPPTTMSSFAICVGGCA